MQSNRLIHALAFVGFLVSVVGIAEGGLPTDYNDGYAPHQVLVPKLQAPPDTGTDLTRSPWTEAALLTGNLDWRRIRTAGLPVQTYLFYDSESIWFAYRSEVASGKGLKANIRERDADLKKDDHFTLEIDVGPTGRVFYRFVVNSIGTLSDSVIIDKGWNSHAVIKTATDEKGWTATIRIPFSDFGKTEPAPGTFWTFNLATRAGTDNSWAPVLGGYHTPEQFARLVFGGEKNQPVRMLEFNPLRAGDNALRVQALAKTRCRIEAMDKQNRPAAR